MASLVMRVPHLSKNELLTSSKVGSMGEFAAGCHHRSSLVFGSRMLQCIYFINTMHTRGASTCLTIKRERKQKPWVVRCNKNNAESSDESDNAPSNRSFRQSSFGSTRLARIIQEVQKKLTEKFKELQKNFPMKVLCLLLGFYCSSVIATSIGQTGDWDILSAGLAVAVVEGIGALMYRAYPLIERLQSLVTMVKPKMPAYESVLTDFFWNVFHDTGALEVNAAKDENSDCMFSDRGREEESIVDNSIDARLSDMIEEEALLCHNGSAREEGFLEDNKPDGIMSAARARDEGISCNSTDGSISTSSRAEASPP